MYHLAYIVLGFQASLQCDRIFDVHLKGNFACADPESLARGGPTLTTFFFVAFFFFLGGGWGGGGAF